MEIRASVENDKKPIRKVHLSAFSQPERETVSQLAQELEEGILAKTEGTVQCASSLNSPELW